MTAYVVTVFINNLNKRNLDLGLAETSLPIPLDSAEDFACF